MRTITVEVPIQLGREDAAASVKQALQAIAPFVSESTLARQDEVFRVVVDKIIETTPIRPLDAMRAALEQKAIAAIFAGTEWLPAEQIGRLRDPNARNPHGTVTRWKAERKVFALSRGGIQFFPRYAFDEVLDPRQAVAQAMEILNEYSPYRLASWFESTNSFLNGRRPREVIGEDPEAVLAAARDQVRGPVHG